MPRDGSTSRLSQASRCSVPKGNIWIIPTPRPVMSVAFSGPGKRVLYVSAAGALNPDGTEIATPPGVRNNAKSIFKITMLAQGFPGRAK